MTEGRGGDVAADHALPLRPAATALADAQSAATAMLTAAMLSDDACSQMAVDVAFCDLDRRVLVAFCLIEASLAWAPEDSVTAHPVHGPVLQALRAGDDASVKTLLVSALTNRPQGSYAALLVQLAYGTVSMVDDISRRLIEHGWKVAADPAAAAGRPAGSAWS